MKAKSRLKPKGDNETPDKYLSDDSQANIVEIDPNINKLNETYSEFRITEESIQKLFQNKVRSTPDFLNTSNIAVRHSIPFENLKSPTKRICVLKRAPANVPAIPSSSLLDQNNLRFDIYRRPVKHSILGSVDDYFKMCLDKNKLTLDDIPSEYHYVLGHGTARRPFSAMFPTDMTQPEKENVFSHKKKIDLHKSNKIIADFDTNALKLWEKRMQERKLLQNHISKKIERIPEKMVFNSAEGFREKMEKRYIISKSIPFHDSGYGFRNGSEFWQQNEVVGIDSINCLHMTNTQTQKGYPPPILHVGVTNTIKNEKGVPLFENNKYQPRQEYHKKRFQELNDVILELDPYPPEFSDLVVLGNPIKSFVNLDDNKSTISELQNTMKNESFASQNISRAETIQGSERTNQFVNGPCLIINSIRLETKNNDNILDPQIDIRILFNGYAKDKCVERLHFQNRGTSIIRYWWKKLDSYDPFKLENKNVRRFYFKSEDGILLPNQDLNFPIIFKSDKSGIFSEMWKLDTLPMLSDGKDILLTMKGVALQRDTLAITRLNIDKYMKYQIADNICRNILDEILLNIDKMHSDQLPEDDEIEDEKELFNKQNRGIAFDIDNINSFKKLNDELSTKETQSYNHWKLDCGILRKNIVSVTSIKSIKKEEMYQKFYKHIDKAMTPVSNAIINNQDQLYRICYRNMLDFISQMTEGLSNLRKAHDMPEMEVKIANDKRRSNVSRQRTNASQISKKQPSAGTSKSKSREPTNLLKDSSNIQIMDTDDIDKGGLTNISDLDEIISIDNEQLFSSQSDSNSGKYHFKSYQIVYSLLDKALNNTIEYWDEISRSDY